MKTASWLLLILANLASFIEAVEVLPGTQPLTWDGDIPLKMVDDLHAFADGETAASIVRRARHWNRDFSSTESFQKSIEPNRVRLAKYLGLRDVLADASPGANRELFDLAGDGTGPGYKITHHVQNVGGWFEADYYKLLPQPLPDGVDPPAVILIPDAGQSPESLLGWDERPAKSSVEFFAERGFRVVVPRRIDRRSELSVVAAGLRKTPQPHREFVFRQAFEMGRHIVGYELALIRVLTIRYGNHFADGRAPRIAVAGQGDGGMLALYAAALDPRIHVVGVSGHFGPREQLWREPIERNAWGLLDEFGDAELAAMLGPNRLIVEACRGPEADVFENHVERRTPAKLATVPLADVRREIDRADRLTAANRKLCPAIELIADKDGQGEPWSEPFLQRIAESYAPQQKRRAPDEEVEHSFGSSASPTEWQNLFFRELVDHTQTLVRESEYVRKAWWKDADRTSRDPEKWRASCEPYRKHLYDEVLGRFDHKKLPPHARTRKIYDEPTYTGYEVVLDVFSNEAEHVGVWAYGILLVPKNITPGERRPVVVCQHGLEGRPQDTIEAGVPGERFYHQFAAKLAERGFVTFSPQNPYIGKDHFRQLVRKLWPLKKTLWSFIVPQHEQITDWLASLEFVDPARIGFYGLSYGGKTAMRVPALVDRYCLSICSGDFNEWIRKITSVRDPFSYMGTHEYEIMEFDLGHTFNYAEMAGLIAPRPFMVERGHRDGVGIDEWVAYEFAKVQLLYADLKIPERTEIEYFDGPHTIHGVGTFDFLHRHLKWPAPK